MSLQRVMSELYLEVHGTKTIKITHASYAHEVDVKKWVSQCAKGTKFTGVKVSSFQMN